MTVITYNIGANTRHVVEMLPGLYIDDPFTLSFLKEIRFEFPSFLALLWIINRSDLDAVPALAVVAALVLAQLEPMQAAVGRGRRAGAPGAPRRLEHAMQVNLNNWRASPGPPAPACTPACPGSQRRPAPRYNP